MRCYIFKRTVHDNTAFLDEYKLIFFKHTQFYGTSRLNPIALRKAKSVCNFGLSECNRVNESLSSNFVDDALNNQASIYKLNFHSKKVRWHS